MRIVVNVDDLGLHPAVRRAVERLSRDPGVVTSATLMVNGPDAEASARLEGVGIGVHLNILRGRPLSQPSDLPSLTREDGLFLGDYGALFRRYLAGSVDLGEVEREWDAQIRRAFEIGVRPTHLDSEKHIHAWPALMDVAARLAGRHGILWMRRPLECHALARLDKGGIRAKFLHVCALLQRRPLSVRRPDLVFGIADQGPALRPERLRAYLKRHAGVRVVEVVCHPGDPLPGDPPVPAEYGSMRVQAQWAAEAATLSDPRWRTVFSEFGAELVHYGQMP